MPGWSGLFIFGSKRVVIFAYGIFLGYLMTVVILNRESGTDVNARWVYMQNLPLEDSGEATANDNTYYTIDDFNYTVEEQVEEKILFDSAKLQLLQDGIEELIRKWKNSPLSRPKPNEPNECVRYTNESAETKVHLVNVWKDETQHRQLTLATQFASDKLPVLERLLHHWSGPMSFALYSTEKTLRDLPNMLLKTNSSLLFRDNIALHLVYQSGEFYPVNFLRNVAFNNTDHKYVFLTDVDFMPSFGSYEYLLGLLDAGKLAKKQILVVPAFEFPDEKSIPEYPRSKEELAKLWKEEKAIQFHGKWPTGHGTTNYTKWFSTDDFYKIKYKFYYEPYIIIDREGAPPYSQDFVGRHGNKVSHLLHVHVSGYDFYVLPSVYLIHYPHPYPEEGSGRNCSQVVLQAFKAKMNYTEPKHLTLRTTRPKRRKIIRKVIRRIIRKEPNS